MMNSLHAGILLAMGMLGCAHASEYFVALNGADTNDGLSRAAAFTTIQKGVDTLQPGDTLTILPGEYFESVRRDDLGDSNKVTTIRAALPGTVVLRGDVPSPAFRKVDGLRFVYVADFTNAATAVNELDSLTILESVPNIQEVEFSPGTFYQDTTTGKLYISPSDLQSAGNHDYTVCTLKGRGGIHLLRPERVILEGLAATGYNTTVRLPRLPHGDSAADSIPWGLYLSNPTKCVIRNCVAWLNAGGIAIQSGDEAGSNLVENCTAYGNSSTHSSEGGNIIVFDTHHDIMRRCYAYVGQGNGVRFYNSSRDPVGRMEDCLGWGHHKADFHVKAGPLAEAHNCVALRHGSSNNRLVFDSVAWSPMGITNDQNEIVLSEVPYLNVDKEFADPVNLDFRLQFTSRFRGAGPDGRDRGPFPYRANIYYVNPGGDDKADGLSLETAWKTLEQAFRALQAGDTLYLSAGRYTATRLAAGTPKGDPIHIRGRGRDRVAITGALAVVNTHGITFERVDFASDVAIRESGTIAFRNCRFLDAVARAENVTGLRLTHNVFTRSDEPAVTFRDSGSLFASGNIFNNSDAPALDVDDPDTVLHSDYNAYAQTDDAWRVAGRARNLEQLAPRWETHAKQRRPEFTRHADDIALGNARDFQTGGPLGTSLGRYIERRRFDSTDLRIAGPFVQSTSDTTANLEWWSSRRAIFEVAWGETPACTNRTTLTPAYAYHPGSPLRPFNSYSLTGLTPNTTYYFRMIDVREHDMPVEQPHVPDPYTNLVSFSTAARPAAPRLLYVATNGNDTAAGQSRSTAWQTINHAAAQARPGDIVLIAEGTYQEHVRVRTTGEEGRPITFKAAPGAKVLIDGAHKTLVAAFSIGNKKNIAIDSLYFSTHQRRNTLGMIRANRVDGLSVTRCFQDGRSPGYDPEFLTAGASRNLLVKNCVMIGGWDGLAVGQSTHVRIENNVIVRPLIRAVCLSGGDSIRIVGNIITDNLLAKRGASLLAGSAFDATVANNCFFLRVPESERPIFGRESGSMAEYDEKKGVKEPNLVTNPQFAVLQTDDENAAEPLYFSEILLHETKDFPDLFATSPEVVKRGIGLQPEAFADFQFAGQKRD